MFSFNDIKRISFLKYPSWDEYHWDQEEMLGNVVLQHSKWDDLLTCVFLEMVLHVVEWEWILDMDVFWVMFVVEVDGRDNMELGMEDIVENIQDIVDFSRKFVSTLVSKIGFGVEMPNLSNERVCSNYFEMDIHNLEIHN